MKFDLGLTPKSDQLDAEYMRMWEFDIRHMVTDRDAAAGAGAVAMAQVRAVERVMPMSRFITVQARAAFMVACTN